VHALEREVDDLGVTDYCRLRSLGEENGGEEDDAGDDGAKAGQNQTSLSIALPAARRCSESQRCA
jgi:hypothetical protein